MNHCASDDDDNDGNTFPGWLSNIYETNDHKTQIYHGKHNFNID